MKICPFHKRTLHTLILDRVEIDYCPVCLGVFLEQGELQEWLETKDRELGIQDIELWKGKRDLSYKKNILCPACNLPMTEVLFLKKGFKVSLCSACRGLWLERGELGRILEILEEEKLYRLWKNGLGSFIEELKEVFVGPKELREEVEDLYLVSKFLLYKKVKKNSV